MIAIIVTEFKQWNAHYRVGTLGALLMIVTLAGCFSILRPELCLTGLMAGALWLGIKAGDQVWCEARVENWIENTHLTPVQVITGKTLAIGGLIFCHCLILTPLMLTMILLWGVGGWDVLTVTLMVFVVTLMIAGIGLSFGFYDTFYNYILGRATVAIWLGVTLLVPALRIINPFCQIWLITAPDFQKRIWIGILVNLGCLLLLIGNLIFLVNRRLTRLTN